MLDQSRASVWLVNNPRRGGNIGGSRFGPPKVNELKAKSSEASISREPQPVVSKTRPPEVNCGNATTEKREEMGKIVVWVKEGC